MVDRGRQKARNGRCAFRVTVRAGENALDLLPCSQANLSLVKFIMRVPTPVGRKNSIGIVRLPVCGELLFKPRQAIGTGLGSDFASGKNPDLQPWFVSS